mmetsp:Transcript_25257/g.72721  ORF Transcript_25257/g.72721 Transcript_25257/m.72721 type:complete len:279 (+) Transcript_25257:742-1578(+)
MADLQHFEEPHGLGAVNTRPELLPRDFTGVVPVAPAKQGVGPLQEVRLGVLPAHAHRALDKNARNQVQEYEHCEGDEQCESQACNARHVLVEGSARDLPIEAPGNRFVHCVEGGQGGAEVPLQGQGVHSLGRRHLTLQGIVADNLCVEHREDIQHQDQQHARPNEGADRAKDQVHDLTQLSHKANDPQQAEDAEKLQDPCQSEKRGVTEFHLPVAIKGEHHELVGDLQQDQQCVEVAPPLAPLEHRAPQHDDPSRQLQCEEDAEEDLEGSHQRRRRVP